MWEVVESESPAQWCAMSLPGLLPVPVSVQTCISPMTRDEEHSMCQNSICVIFNIIVFILPVLSLSGLALCLGLFLCMSINTRAMWNYSETLVTVGSHSYLLKIALLFPHRDWLAACIFRILTLGGTAFLPGRPSIWAGRGLVRSFTGSACEACFAATIKNIRKYISCYYIFAFGVEWSNFYQNLARALHCHDSWGFTSLSTGMIVDFWLYFYIYF